MTIQKAMDSIEEILCSAVRSDNSIAYELDTNDCDWIEMAKSAWIENKYCGYYSCSNCGGVGTANGMSPIEDCHLNYCPYCGAKMDEVMKE